MATVSNMLLVSIGSQEFPSSFLRMDGTGVTKSVGAGAGTVNCQSGVGPFESLMIENHPDDNTFSILASNFPKVYLRMDASEVKIGNSYPDGAGTVNCQFTAGPYEQFRFEAQPDGTKAIASVQWPGIYLRMDNPGSQGGGSGAGTVNCQTGVGPYEKFIVKAI